MSTLTSVYIRDTKVQKVVIESGFKNSILQAISVFKEPGQTYETGIFFKRKKTAKERLYKYLYSFSDRTYTRQQLIDEVGVDPEKNNEETIITIHYTQHYIIKKFDDLEKGMAWVSEMCPDFNTLVNIESKI